MSFFLLKSTMILILRKHQETKLPQTTQTAHGSVWPELCAPLFQIVYDRAALVSTFLNKNIGYLF